MTKFKTYKKGKISGKAYCKTVGNGFECGFYFDGKLVFLGNFVHASESKIWYTYMNREIKTFVNKYKVGTQFPKTWFSHFLGTHLYQCYYRFLDKQFSKYQGHYASLNTKNIRKYQKYSKTLKGSPRVALLKAA